MVPLTEIASGMGNVGTARKLEAFRHGLRAPIGLGLLPRGHRPNSIMIGTSITTNKKSGDVNGSNWFVRVQKVTQEAGAAGGLTTNEQPKLIHTTLQVIGNISGTYYCGSPVRSGRCAVKQTAAA